MKELIFNNMVTKMRDMLIPDKGFLVSEPACINLNDSSNIQTGRFSTYFQGRKSL